jgi:hypothetical protein
MKMRNMNKAICLAAVSILGGSAMSQAASLMTFTASPTSPTLPEFIWTNEAVPQLLTGPGAQGNADGMLPEALQTPGGLGIQTPLSIVAPGSSPLITGGTALDDVTMTLANFRATAPAVDPGGGILIQPFGQVGENRLPTFSVLSTDPDGPGPLKPVLLLQGAVSRGSITALDGESSGSVLSAQVTYTGGLIYDALIANPGATTTGSLSWSMLDETNTVTGQPAVTIDPGTGYLVPFSANATGLFSTPSIPEPATTSLLAVSSLAMMVRRRRSVRA